MNDHSSRDAIGVQRARVRANDLAYQAAERMMCALEVGDHGATVANAKLFLLLRQPTFGGESR